MKRRLPSSRSRFSSPNAKGSMLVKRFIAAGLFFALPLISAVTAVAAEKIESFDSASARFEQNATDGDVEAVFEAIAGDDGLTKLTITSPDGRAIVDFSAPGRSATGMRQFRFESPEPTNV